MKRKNIDAMREVRLWIGQIVVPGITLVTATLSIPEVRSVVALKAVELSEKTKEKIMYFKNKTES